MAKRRPRFEFHHEAVLDSLEAAKWYADRSIGAAEKFKTELRRAEDSVTRHPISWAPYLHGTRCFKLARFPFALVYIERDDRVVGIAVAHLKRRPGY
jgi:hypothetical protein